MTNETLFLQLLRQFLHPEGERAEPEGLEPEQIPELLSLAEAHSLYAVALDGIYGSTAFQKLPEPEQKTLKARARRIVIGQTCRTAAFLEVYRVLRSRGLTPLVMKGVILRELYPQPDYRPSSDEDLLVKKEEYMQLDRVLRELNFEPEPVDKPLQAHEITYWHRENGMHLEIHLSLFPEDSQAYGRLNREFPDIFEKKTAVSIQGTEVLTLCPTQHMLYLLCHGLKHFIHSGFGARQLADMVLFAEAYGAEIDWNRIEQQTRREHMYVFWQNLFAIGERYLGFSRQRAGMPGPRGMEPDPEALLSDLMDSGVYGQRTMSRAHSANITVEAAGSGGRGLKASLFPGRDYMGRRYPYVKKHPWLLPAAWAQRAFGYLRSAGGRGAAESADLGKRRVALLKKYGIIENSGK